jgi:hypothetical protein
MYGSDNRLHDNTVSLAHSDIIQRLKNTTTKENLKDLIEVCVSQFINAMYDIKTLTDPGVYGRVVTCDTLNSSSLPGSRITVLKLNQSGGIPAVGKGDTTNKRKQKPGYVYANRIPSSDGYLNATDGSFRENNPACDLPFCRAYQQFKEIGKTLASNETDDFVRITLAVNNGQDNFNNRRACNICLLPPCKSSSVMTAGYSPAVIRSYDVVRDMFREHTIGHVCHQLEGLFDVKFNLEYEMYPGGFGTDYESLGNLESALTICDKLRAAFFKHRQTECDSICDFDDGSTDRYSDLLSGDEAKKRVGVHQLCLETMALIDSINAIVGNLLPEKFAACVDATTSNEREITDDQGVRVITPGETMMVRLVG